MSRIPLWNDARVRGVFYQVAALGLVVVIGILPRDHDHEEP